MPLLPNEAIRNVNSRHMPGSEESYVRENTIQGASRGPRDCNIQTAGNFFAPVLHPAKNPELTPRMWSVDIVGSLCLADGDFTAFRYYATQVGASVPDLEWPGKGSPQTISRGGTVATKNKKSVRSHLAGHPQNKFLMCARCRHPQFSPTRSTASRIRESSPLRAPKIPLRSGLLLSSISSVTVIASKRPRVRSMRA